jgi:stage V sporulation protein D (sporulation-specific penicillin-binding protein)
MVTAVSSVANGGRLMEPHLVRATERNGNRTLIQPKVLRETVNLETASELTTIMEGVVERGTAKASRIDGFTIAGKTGTAAKLVRGVYSKSEYMASFVGFLPSRKPVVSILVVVDSPHGKGYTGGSVAAPIFRRIAEATIRHLAVPRSLNPEPPVLVRRDAAESAVSTRVASGSSDVLQAALVPSENNTMPDLRGLSARDALKRMVSRGICPRINGRGVVVGQRPEMGSSLDMPIACELWLARAPRPAPPDPGTQP